MFKNVASQKIEVFVFDTSTNAPKTGDAANLTLYVSKDHGAVTVLGDTSATEMDATNAKGVYVFDLTQAETNADELTFTGKSSTANVTVTPRFISTTPPNFTAQSIDANGRVDVIKLAGTTQSAGDIVALIGGIGTSGGAAVQTDANTDNAAGGISGVTSGTTKVGTQTGTFANTSTANGTYHQITHSANAIDWVYQFLTGGASSPVGASWSGYVDGSNDTITAYAWNHVGAAWESLGTIAGHPGTANVTKNWALYARHRGTSAAELGKVYLRFACTGMTSPILYTDQVFVSYAITSRTVGYADGAVWVKAAGTSGTEVFVNGTADNPCPWADALTIAAALGIGRFRILNGETVPLTSSAAGKSLVGAAWSLALGGQEIGGAYIEGAVVTGTSTGASSVQFERCTIGTSTLPAMLARNCYLSGVLTMIAAAGDYFFLHCGDGVAGVASAQITFKANCNLHLQNYSGGVDLQDMDATNTAEWGGRGKLRLMSGCVGGSAIVRGLMDLVREDGGAVTLTDTARWNEDQSVASVAGSVGSIAAGGVTSGSFAASAVTAAALAADAGAEIASAVWTRSTELGLTQAAGGSPGDYLFTADALANVPTSTGGGSGLDAAGVRAAIGMASANLDAQLATIAGYVDTEVLAIKSTTDALFSLLEPAAGSPSEYRLTADALQRSTTVLGLAAGDMDAQFAQVISAMPSSAALADAVFDEALAGHMIVGSAGRALYDADKRGARVTLRGAVGAAPAPSTTQFAPSSLDATCSSVDQFLGRVIVFDKDTTTTALQGQAAVITANTADALPLLTFDALTSAPVAGDTFSIV